MKKTGLISALLLGLGACSGLVVDRSMDAVQAGDYTLAMSACENTPGGGMDICRVREGEAIASSWKLFVPTDTHAIVGWEIDVYYKDALHTVHQVGSGGIIEIPWKGFFGQETWTRDLDGEALALVTVRYKDAQGLEEIVKFRGIAKLVVTAKGYDRLPIDGGFSAWGETCKIQYSTAGRGGVSCK